MTFIPFRRAKSITVRRVMPSRKQSAIGVCKAPSITKNTLANVFFVIDGALHTPIADCFLDGITRRTVIDLARRKGIKVIERRIMPEEMKDFSECFICGTGAEVTPVAQIGDLFNFTPGAVSQILIEAYDSEVHNSK